MKGLGSLILFFWLIHMPVLAQSPLGSYELEVFGWKNTTSGRLEVAGEPGDYFGRVTFQSKRERVFALGSDDVSPDTMVFYLGDRNGYLKLYRKANQAWQGAFKYFGLRGELKAVKTGENAPEALQRLTKLKPLTTGVITTKGQESFPVFDTEAEGLYYTREGHILLSLRAGEEWATPKAIRFSTSARDSAPYLSPDGTYMVFTSDRPFGSGNKKNLWRSDRVNGQWSEPTALPAPVNIDSLGDYHAAIAGNGDLYFVSYNRPGGKGKSDIYHAELRSDGSWRVRNLGDSINSDKSEADVFIAPDESYLLFASTDRTDSYGADDIYISQRENDNWRQPRNLGPLVNSFAYEYGAWVDQLNGYLYFNSFRRGSSDIYRIALAELEVFSDLE
ncbi:MAG: hypothetical protein R8G66_15410 [Cytophagales bacterium]|nr:hypothetical protein [Cytophagales bacterium]